MKKIIIIGSPGAGKSTFARALRDKTSLPLFHLDMLWHKEDKTNISREEFDRILGEILAKDRWIVDGNYMRTLVLRLKACDTVFLLDFDKEVCLQGARERVGKPREDIPWIEETLDEEFRKFIETFHDNELSRIYNLLETAYNNKNIVIFKDRNSVNEYVKAYNG